MLAIHFIINIKNQWWNKECMKLFFCSFYDLELTLALRRTNNAEFILIGSKTQETNSTYLLRANALMEWAFDESGVKNILWTEKLCIKSVGYTRENWDWVQYNFLRLVF